MAATDINAKFTSKFYEPEVKEYLRVYFNSFSQNNASFVPIVLSFIDSIRDENGKRLEAAPELVKHLVGKKPKHIHIVVSSIFSHGNSMAFCTDFTRCYTTSSFPGGIIPDNMNSKDNHIEVWYDTDENTYIRECLYPVYALELSQAKKSQPLTAGPPLKAGPPEDPFLLDGSIEEAPMNERHREAIHWHIQHNYFMSEAAWTPAIQGFWLDFAEFAQRLMSKKLKMQKFLRSTNAAEGALGVAVGASAVYVAKKKRLAKEDRLAKNVKSLKSNMKSC